MFPCGDAPMRGAAEFSSGAVRPAFREMPGSADILIMSMPRPYRPGHVRLSFTGRESFRGAACVLGCALCFRSLPIPCRRGRGAVRWSLVRWGGFRRAAGFRAGVGVPRGSLEAGPGVSAGAYGAIGAQGGSGRRGTGCGCRVRAMPGRRSEAAGIVRPGGPGRRRADAGGVSAEQAADRVRGRSVGAATDAERCAPREVGREAGRFVR